MTTTPLRWRKSSFSASSSECVELAPAPDGRVLVRNSNHPDAGTLTLTPGALTAWLDTCRAGHLDT
jgi:hypothetical protein